MHRHATKSRHRHRRHLATRHLSISRRSPANPLSFKHSQAAISPLASLAHPVQSLWRGAGKGQDTLKISIQESDHEMLVKLEGRIAGPWTAELGRVWKETVPRLANRKVVLDLCDVTYADSSATELLLDMYAQTHAEILATSVWTQSLADYIVRGDAQTQNQER